MRIAANPPAPPPALALKLPTAALAAAVRPAAPLDQAALLQVAAIAAGTPWTALDHLVAAERGGSGLVPGATVPVPSALPAAVREAVQTLLTPSTAAPLPAVNRLAGPAAPTAPAAIPALLVNAAATQAVAAARDRLSLSPLTATLRADPAAPKAQPSIEFTLKLLAGLTGEPTSRLQLLAFGAPGMADSPVAALIAKGPGELLQLLVRGTVHSADAKQVEVTLGLSVQRQAGPVLLDAVALDSIRATLEQLAQMQIDLDYPGAAAGLAGHSARFQAVLDPVGLWPMQSFILSGLLILGQARDAPEVDDVGEADDTEPDAQAAGEDGDGRDPERDATAQAPRAMAETTADTPPASLDPADGGLPIISASHWLELELRHWRVQLRRWMALQADVSAS